MSHLDDRVSVHFAKQIAWMSILGKKQPPTPCLTNTQLNLEQPPGQGCFDLVVGGECEQFVMLATSRAELVISQ